MKQPTPRRDTTRKPNVIRKAKLVLSGGFRWYFVRRKTALRSSRASAVASELTGSWVFAPVQRVTTSLRPNEGAGEMRYRAGRFSGWTKAEIQQFEARWAAGTKQRRVFALVFQTGLRAFELTNLGLDGFRDGNFTVVLGGSKRLPALSD